MNAGILITNWNGKELLKIVLPKIIAAAQICDDIEIYLIDDCSTDDSIDFIKNNFSQIKVLKTTQNSGFAHAVNFGMKNIHTDLIIIMNNDIYPEKQAFKKLIDRYKSEQDDKLFAITPSVFDWDEKTFLYGNRGVKWRKGHIVLYEKPIDDEKTQTFFASGGSALFNRKIFLSLGGFNSIYYPLYYEEMDISYKALKTGRRIIYDKNIIFYHRVQATIVAQQGKKKVKIISARNHYLFTWINITDTDKTIEHIIWLPLLLIRDIFRLRFRFVKAFLAALLLLNKALKNRKQNKKIFIHTDKEILEKINKILE